MSQNTPPNVLSIDLGSATTRVVGGAYGADSPATLPTVFAEGSSPNAFVVGEQSLRQSVKRPVWPLHDGVVTSEQACLTYLRILRKAVAPEAPEVWAILSAPSADLTKETQRLGRAAGLAFERALVIPGVPMATFAIQREGLHRCKEATIVDLGAATIKLGILSGGWPEPKRVIHIAAGGSVFDVRLAQALNTLFPDFAISTTNARRLKERYARSSESPYLCLVQVVREGQRRVIDVGQAMFESLRPMADVAAQAIGTVLGTRDTPRARTYGREVILTGGGALMPGIRDALLTALRSRGYPTQKIHIPDRPGELVVRGGWYLARTLKTSHWEVLV